MKLKREEKLKAIALREQGYSLNEIIDRVGVAKSSVSVWVRNIPLTVKAKKRLLTKIKLGQLIAAEKKRKHTQEIVANYREEALKELETKNIDFVLGKIICSLLYWCEGAKNCFNGVRFTNSDPKLIKAFLNLFRKSFDVDENKFRVGLHLHKYHNVKKQITFWSDITTVKKNKFIRPFLKPHTGKRIRKNYPGCATIYYHSNKTARQLLAVAETFLQEKGA